MKIIFLGSPEFAVICLKKVLQTKHKVLAVITQPDKPGNRGKITPPPLKVFAESQGIPVYQFPKISRDGIEILKELNPDLMVTAAYGQILSQQIIDIPRYGIINVHASLLPKYRGASPIQSAIIAGESETGITIMQTEAGLDTGDIISVEKVKINGDETSGELALKLAYIGGDLLCRTLDDIECQEVERVKQMSENATITSKLKREDALITWQKTAEQIKNLVLGANPDPIAYASLNDEQVKIYRAKIADNDIESTSEPVGTVLKCSSSKHGVFVQCGYGVLELLDIQFPGGRIAPAKAFFGGRRIKVGDRFQGRIPTDE